MEEKTTIVIPTYNEKENITELVETIKKLYPLVRIFIVDDHSPDGTGIAANALALKYHSVSVLHRPQKAASVRRIETRLERCSLTRMFCI